MAPCGRGRIRARRPFFFPRLLLEATALVTLHILLRSAHYASCSLILMRLIGIDGATAQGAGQWCSARRPAMRPETYLVGRRGANEDTTTRCAAEWCRLIILRMIRRSRTDLWHSGY